MVFKFQLQRWLRITILSVGIATVLCSSPVRAIEDELENPEMSREPAASANSDLKDARTLYRQGKYFQSARYAFSAANQSDRLQARALARVTLGLVRSGLYHSASYFFIRTLQTRNRTAIRAVLTKTEDMIFRVSGDLFRPYLLKYTELSDYNQRNLSAYQYMLGKSELLKGRYSGAIRHLSGVDSQSPLWPYALQARGTALAIRGDSEGAIGDFSECVSRASRIAKRESASRDDAYTEKRIKTKEQREAEDLKARCQAGIARSYYQANRFDLAERAWDRIPKQSFVWTDILFEQAWNAYAQEEYNRSLGKLVTYKSPSLRFVFNSEVDVLRAQSFLALCQWEDVNRSVNEFNRKYDRIGKELKRFLKNKSLRTFYEAGKVAATSKLHTRSEFNQLLNRFVRSPYFMNLVESEKEIDREMGRIRGLARLQEGVSHSPTRGFPGFLRQVLKWRNKTLQLLGGAFVKNSLLDHYTILLNDFDKMSFIKLEMLKQAKESLAYDKPSGGDRFRGSVEPHRKGNQYKWTFNGEFWADEIGDYVFALKSKCGT